VEQKKLCLPSTPLLDFGSAIYNKLKLTLMLTHLTTVTIILSKTLYLCPQFCTACPQCEYFCSMYIVNLSSSDSRLGICVTKLQLLLESVYKLNQTKRFTLFNAGVE